MSTTPVWLYEFVSTTPPATPAQNGIMTFGLDVDTLATNPIGKYGNIHFPGVPFVASLSCVTPPTTATAIFDVKFSHDNGVTWTSIFPTNAYQYPVGATGFRLFTSFAHVTFAVGDLFRVDVLQSGGAVGIEGVIRWAPLSAPVQRIISGRAKITSGTGGGGGGGGGTPGYTAQTITGKAKIGYHTTNATIPGKARISVTTTRTLSSKARINKLHNQTITGVARIT
jgi:hypothetical protein